MIKILRAEYIEGWQIRLHFSDGSYGVFDAGHLVAREGSLLQPLRNSSYFQDFHLELGALCWKNGLELSPSALYRQLSSAGLLKTDLRAA